MRMSYQPLEELLPKASMSVYRLVRLACYAKKTCQ